MKEQSPILGQAKCPYCGCPLTTEINSYTEHVENCKKNPDNKKDEEA